MRENVSRLSWWALAGAAVLAGCCSVQQTDVPANDPPYRLADGSRPISHAVASNYGWYLFNAIPLVTGNANVESFFPWAFFSDDVRFDVLQTHLVELAEKRGAQLRELNLSRDESIFFDVPGLSIPLPIPYLFCYHEKQVSAVLAEGSPKPSENASARDVARLLEELDDGEVRK